MEYRSVDRRGFIGELVGCPHGYVLSVARSLKTGAASAIGNFWGVYGRDAPRCVSDLIVKRSNALTPAVDHQTDHIWPGVVAGLIQVLTLTLNFAPVQRSYQQAFAAD
jgi:hypothetical protein